MLTCPLVSANTLPRHVIALIRGIYLWGWRTLSLVVLGDDGEVTDYQDQLKQMLQDLATEKEKDVEKPLPLMNQV